MKRHVVEVNEAVVEASRQGVDWWVLFAHRFRDTGRLVYVKGPCVIGGVVQVACDDKSHAADLAALMLEQGMPRTAVTVKAVAA